MFSFTTIMKCTNRQWLIKKSTNVSSLPWLRCVYKQTSSHYYNLCQQCSQVYFRKNMPLFSNKFAPRTIPVRRQDTCVIKNEFGSDYASKELSLEVGPLKVKLGDVEVAFEDGQWIPTYGKAGATHKENIRLKKELEHLEEENNMLRLKFEILLDMMTDKTVEAEQAEVKRAHSVNSLKNKKKQKW